MDLLPPIHLFPHQLFKFYSFKIKFDIEELINFQIFNHTKLYNALYHHTLCDRILSIDNIHGKGKSTIDGINNE